MRLATSLTCIYSTKHQSATFMLLSTVLQSRATVPCLHTECCLPATEVGDDGALEIILKHNHYKYLFVSVENMEHNMRQNYYKIQGSS